MEWGEEGISRWGLGKAWLRVGSMWCSDLDDSPLCWQRQKRVGGKDLLRTRDLETGMLKQQDEDDWSDLHLVAAHGASHVRNR